MIFVLTLQVRTKCFLLSESEINKVLAVQNPWKKKVKISLYRAANNKLTDHTVTIFFKLLCPIRNNYYVHY